MKENAYHVSGEKEKKQKQPDKQGTNKTKQNIEIHMHTKNNFESFFYSILRNVNKWLL